MGKFGLTNTPINHRVNHRRKRFVQFCGFTLLLGAKGNFNTIPRKRQGYFVKNLKNFSDRPDESGVMGFNTAMTRR
jgi:hypothetical protein